jgi:hypothetical protein
MQAQVSGEEGGALCSVTDETAATGKHSLKFTDAPGLARIYQPHFFYQLRPLRRKVSVSLDLRVEQGAITLAECRDAGKPYLVGPSIRVDDHGQMTGNGKMLLTVPRGKWFHIKMTFNLGKNSTGTYNLAVTLPGQKSQTFIDLPFGNKQFDCFQWFGFMSMANAKAVYYLDNLKVSMAK